MSSCLILLVNIFFCDTWRRFLQAAIPTQIIGYLISSNVVDNATGIFTHVYLMIVPLLFATGIFAANEKVRKEMFILNHTNANTKRQLARMFNAGGAKIVVEVDGSVKFYNQEMERLFMQEFGISLMPKNLLTFIHNDNESKIKLDRMLRELDEMNKSGGLLGTQHI